MNIAIRSEGIAGTDLREIADWAVKHCPVTDAIARAVPLSIEVRPG